MVWNEPKDKNPWQGGNAPNNSNKQPSQQPPDLDEMLRKFVSKFGDMFGGKGQKTSSQGGSAKWQPKGGSNGAITLIGIVILVIYALSGIYIVAPAERAVITQFGRYVDTVGPGPHWIPRFIRAKEIVDVSQVMSSQHSGYMLTTDQNIVHLELAVQYRIDNPEAFLFNVKDPINSLQQATDSAMRQVVGAETLERILTTGRAEIRQKISDNISAMLQKYNSGLMLVDVAMQPAKVPDPVRAAFDDVIKALEDKDRMENQAKAYSTRMVQVARGQAARFAEEAEGYRTQVESQAQGEANRFNAIYAEYKQSPAIMRERLYLQMMERVLTNTSKVLVDPGMANSLLYLPLDKIMQNAQNAMGNTTTNELTTTNSAAQSANAASGARDNARNRSSR
jgi:membrane protease subunit HflK